MHAGGAASRQPFDDLFSAGVDEPFDIIQLLLRRVGKNNVEKMAYPFIGLPQNSKPLPGRTFSAGAAEEFVLGKRVSLVLWQLCKIRVQFFAIREQHVHFHGVIPACVPVLSVKYQP